MATSQGRWRAEAFVYRFVDIANHRHGWRAHPAKCWRAPRIQTSHGSIATRIAQNKRQRRPARGTCPAPKLPEMFRANLTTETARWSRVSLKADLQSNGER